MVLYWCRSGSPSAQVDALTTSDQAFPSQSALNPLPLGPGSEPPLWCSSFICSSPVSPFVPMVPPLMPGVLLLGRTARLQSLSISPELHRQGFPSGSRSPPRRASSQTRQSTLGTMLPATLPHAAGRNSDSPPVVSGSSSVADSALLTHLRNPLPSITLSRGRQALCPGHER